jgi:probable phosphoglycerate mutase
MELIFVRHGEPVSIASSDGSPADPHLSPRGEWQAARVCDWLACEPIDAVITSNKLRAQQTVADLATKLGIEPTVLHDLDEIDRNCPVYAPFQMLPEKFPETWEKVLAQEWDEIGWDTPEVFLQRVVGAFEHIVATRPGERVVVGCHGGVIGAILAHILGASSPFTFANVPFASISRLRIHADGRGQLASLCEVGHFDAARARVVGPDGEGFEGRGFVEGLRAIEADVDRNERESGSS